MCKSINQIGSHWRSMVLFWVIYFTAGWVDVALNILCELELLFSQHTLTNPAVLDNTHLIPRPKMFVTCNPLPNKSHPSTNRQNGRSTQVTTMKTEFSPISLQSWNNACPLLWLLESDGKAFLGSMVHECESNSHFRDYTYFILWPLNMLK